MKGLRFVTFSGRGYVLSGIREESSALTARLLLSFRRMGVTDVRTCLNERLC